ncbi:MAG TPA: C10 family peptidase, partial [Bacteroidales bacterium]|nr:C10 family peptidase [Bacteroidales bacterium]
MYYYKYPTQGNGYHSYIHPVYGYLSANFGSTTYEWVPMLNSINSSNLPIATLIYHCGVAVEMNYSPSGSGALLDVAAFALKNYFKYSNNIKYYERDNYPYVWNDLLTSNLDLGRPIIYAGFDPNNYNGHAFIIDGYDNTNYYHINWGWGGAYNGYFYIDNLNPGSSDYTAGQQAIVNIYPQSNYPLYCSGTKTYTYSAGVFDDGSGPIKDYLNNTDCLWLIKPSDAVDNIKLKFLQFNTETNVDKVIVYDGSDIYAPVLGTFSGNSLPNIVTSTGNEMLVRFITNGNNTTAGWLAEYYSTKSLYCSGTIVLTEPSDVFSDGSGNAQYNNNSNCKWIIAPPDVSSITISFIDFEVEPVNDFVKIIDPTKSPAVTLATYSGFSVPQPFTFYGQELLVLFKTGPSITYQGWTAQYTTTPLSVNNLLNIEDNNLIFYPNPTNDIVNITFISNNAKPLLVNVYDEIGNKLLTKKFQTAKGINNYTLSLKSLPSGIYILNLLNEEVTYSKKILIYK